MPTETFDALSVPEQFSGILGLVASEATGEGQGEALADLAGVAIWASL